MKHPRRGAVGRGSPLAAPAKGACKSAAQPRSCRPGDLHHIASHCRARPCRRLHRTRDEGHPYPCDGCRGPAARRRGPREGLRNGQPGIRTAGARARPLSDRLDHEARSRPSCCLPFTSRTARSATSPRAGSATNGAAIASSGTSGRGWRRSSRFPMTDTRSCSSPTCRKRRSGIWAGASCSFTCWRWRSAERCANACPLAKEVSRGGE
jgi:hypothetical protein